MIWETSRVWVNSNALKNSHTVVALNGGIYVPEDWVVFLVDSLPLPRHIEANTDAPNAKIPRKMKENPKYNALLANDAILSGQLPFAITPFALHDIPTQSQMKNAMLTRMYAAIHGS